MAIAVVAYAISPLSAHKKQPLDPLHWDYQSTDPQTAANGTHGLVECKEGGKSSEIVFHFKFRYFTDRISLMLRIPFLEYKKLFQYQKIAKRCMCPCR